MFTALKLPEFNQNRFTSKRLCGPHANTKGSSVCIFPENVDVSFSIKNEGDPNQLLREHCFPCGELKTTDIVVLCFFVFCFVVFNA